MFLPMSGKNPQSFSPAKGKVQQLATWSSPGTAASTVMRSRKRKVVRGEPIEALSNRQDPWFPGRSGACDLANPTSVRSSSRAFVNNCPKTSAKCSNLATLKD